MSFTGNLFIADFIFDDVDFRINEFFSAEKFGFEIKEVFVFVALFVVCFDSGEVGAIVVLSEKLIDVDTKFNITEQSTFYGAEFFVVFAHWDHHCGID